MRVHQLEIPKALCQLIDAGVWPTAPDEVGRQEYEPILGEDAAKVLSPEDTKIVLMNPPFHTIADEVSDGNEWWIEDLSNVGEIDYDKAVIIADFGIGTDSPIILYYDQPEPPSVMYLKWSWSGMASVHSWVRTHSSFEEFASDVGLTIKNDEIITK
jgi:hypothetical protein